MLTRLQRKYIITSILLLGAMSAVVLAFWTNGSFAGADTPRDEKSILALNAYLYLTIEGASQGIIEGDITEAGKEGWIACISYQHSVVSPRDAASGLPTGKRQHKPFVITKEVDKATPLLYQALTDNETLLKVTLYFYRPTTTSEEKYFTIRLENAHIASMQAYRHMPPDPFDMPPDPYDMPLYEQAAFIYEKITWTHVTSGTESSDSWAAVEE